MGDRPADARIALLRHQLDQAFDVPSWHGANLMASLRGVRPEDALWRPQPGRHNIAELAVHAAYWKYRVYRLLSGRPPRSFELKGSNFFAREAPLDDEGWRRDQDLLRAWHARLRDAVSALRPAQLSDRPGTSRFTRSELVCGAAAHDLYHAGQIQLIKRLHSQES